MNKLKAWEVFSTVAREGGLAAAARVLSMSPPTVTRIMNELEEYLGTPLLHRSTRAIHLTETGQSYLLRVERILDDAAAADADAQGARHTPRGTLRVTSSVTFGEYYIAPIIGEYQKLYPSVLTHATFVDRNVKIIDEGYDVAVRIGELADSNLRAIRVGRVRQIVCAAPDYLQKFGTPRHPEDLRDHQIIHYRGAGFEDDIWHFDNDFSIKLPCQMAFSTIVPCIAMAKAGLGLVRVLNYQIGPESNVNGVETVLDDYSQKEWPIHLVHAESHGHSAKLRLFLDIAANRLRDNRFLNTP